MLDDINNSRMKSKSAYFYVCTHILRWEFVSRKAYGHYICLVAGNATTDSAKHVSRPLNNKFMTFVHWIAKKVVTLC